MATKTVHKTKTEFALQQLRERIRTGELEPGSRLRLNVLTTELGMSPTPIREALRLLQADHLVVFRPHQGIVVAEVSQDEIAEIVRLRCLLEPLAVRLATPALHGARLREIERLHRRVLGAIASGRGTAISDCNASWHWAIYELCGSAHLKEFIRRLWEVYPWRTMWALEGRPERSAEEHTAIMDAIEAADADLAAERMRDHIAGGQEFLIAELSDSDSQTTTA